MKKTRIILCIITFVLIAVSVSCSAVCCNRYKQPSQKVYKCGESFVVEGLEYKLKNIEMYTFYDAMSKYNMTADDFMVGEEYLDWAPRKKVFIGEIEITCVSEDYRYDVNGNILGYNRYLISSSHEYDFERKLNGNGYNQLELKKGEQKTIYVAYSLMDYAFFEETWENLSVDDISIYVYDSNNGIEYFMNMSGKNP